MTRKTIIYLFTAAWLLTATMATAAERHGRPYTEADPLVMVSDWDFEPYEFNDKGTPSGYCVEVMDLILTRLNIPHRFEMREWAKAVELFENEDADLIHAIGKSFERAPYVQTKNLATFYNVQIAYRKGTKPIKRLSQLTNTDTIVVKQSDYAAFYLNQLPFRPYYIRYATPHDALIALARGQIKYYIWGKTPMEQDIRELGIDNVRLGNIDIPTGELHIIGRDQALINAIDDEYARMSQAGELELISDKWFHPERVHHDTPLHAFFVIAGVLLLIVGFLILSQLSRRRIRNAVTRTRDVGNMMTQALNMGDFYVFEHDLTTERVNNIHGNLLPAEGMDADDFFSLISPKDQEQARSSYGNLMRNPDRPFNIELVWNGRFLKGYSIAETEDGKLTHIIYTAKDITKEVEEERANNDVGNRYMKIFHSNTIAMSFYGADGMLIDLNKSMSKLCEFDDIREAFFRKTCMFDVPMLKNDFDRNSKQPFHVCQHMLYPEIGLDKFLDFRIRPVFDENDNIAYYVVTSRDITADRDTDLEQRRRGKELEKISQTISQYEHNLNYLLKNSNMYIWSLSFDTHRIVFTRSLRVLEFEESINDYISTLYEDETQAAIEHLKRLTETKEPFSTIHHFKRTPVCNHPEWYAISGMPTTDEEGNCTGYFGVLRNMDDLMNAQEQLKKERTRAEASGLMKSAFLANMTHEIRTPLNAIVGFSDLLQIIEEPDDRQEFIRIIRNNCDMLLRLINDILEASDTGQTLAIAPTDVDFAVVFNDICQTLEQRVQEPGVQFLKENPYTTFPTQLDKGRVQQVITNFVTNAVKYTHEGHIKVGYRQQDDGLYIYCEDTGAGIPKDKQASVFERFVKLNDFVQGTGLGLSICKTIAERCGGKIGVFSEGEGKGSTFWLWIPCKQMNN